MSAIAHFAGRGAAMLSHSGPGKFYVIRVKRFDLGAYIGVCKTDYDLEYPPGSLKGSIAIGHTGKLFVDGDDKGKEFPEFDNFHFLFELDWNEAGDTLDIMINNKPAPSLQGIPTDDRKLCIGGYEGTAFHIYSPLELAKWRNESAEREL